MCDYQKNRLRSRVSEILEDYLMDSKEAYAECTLRFLRMDGQSQEKVLRWIHPTLDREMSSDVASLKEVLMMSPDESGYWNRANEIITKRNAERQKGIYNG